MRERERRTVIGAVIVAVAALAFVYGVVPFARRWQEREATIAAQAERLAQLRGLVEHEADLRTALERRAASAGSGQQRVLTGDTPALAAASLQSLLQGYADRSRVTVSRLDVAGAPDSTAAALPAIPATVSAIGDIYGITELISLVQYGPHLLEITELTVRPNPALRGELLQLTVKLHAAFLES